MVNGFDRVDSNGRFSWLNAGRIFDLFWETQRVMVLLGDYPLTPNPSPSRERVVRPVRRLVRHSLGVGGSSNSVGGMDRVRGTFGLDMRWNEAVESD